MLLFLTGLAYASCGTTNPNIDCYYGSDGHKIYLINGSDGFKPPKGVGYHIQSLTTPQI